MQVLRDLFAPRWVACALAFVWLGGGVARGDSNWIWPLVGGGQQVTGTFLEARQGRFHTGVDLRTEGREGLVVVAPTEGRVLRLRASSEGYGIALYLRLPDGRTMVFAHLSRLADRFRAVVEAAQFRDGVYEQDLHLREPGMSVARGEVLALSGSTGVGAPHLHVELRDPRGRPMDPLPLFSLRDDRPPVVEAVRLVPLSADARIAGDFGPVEVAPGDSLRLVGDWGVQVRAHDRRPGNEFRLAVESIELRQDAQVLHRLRGRVIDFAQSDQMELVYDRPRSGMPPWIRLYSREGLDLEAVESVGGGRVRAAASVPWSPVEVVAEDDAGSAAAVVFFVGADTVASGGSATGPDPRPWDVEVLAGEFGLGVHLFGPGDASPAGIRLAPTGSTDQPPLAVEGWTRTATGRWAARIPYERLPEGPWVLRDGAGRTLVPPQTYLVGDELCRIADGRLEIRVTEPRRFPGGCLRLRPLRRSVGSLAGLARTDWPGVEIERLGWVHPGGVELRAVAAAADSGQSLHRGWVLVEGDRDPTWLGTWEQSTSDWGLRGVRLESGILLLVDDDRDPQLSAGTTTLRVRGESEREAVAGVRLARWPSFEVAVAESGSGLESARSRAWVDDRAWPLRHDPEEHTLAVDFDRDPGPGAHRIRIEVRDRSGRIGRGEWTIQLRP